MAKINIWKQTKWHAGKSLILLFIIFFYLKSPIFSQTINVTGNWDYAISTSNITEAGLDFTGVYTSDRGQVLIDVKSNGNNNWYVYVRKMDVHWHDDLRIKVKRNGNGNGGGNGSKINGGTDQYIRIKDTDRLFFSGKKNRSNIPIRFRMRKVSVLIPADTYQTTIIYTITDQ